MKKVTVIVLALGLMLFSSFKLSNGGYPCHPLGDLGPCTHVQHSLGDIGPCGHTYYDAWGNLCTQHANDLYPCTHRVHVNDVYQCTHICW